MKIFVLIYTGNVYPLQQAPRPRPQSPNETEKQTNTHISAVMQCNFRINRKKKKFRSSLGHM